MHQKPDADAMGSSLGLYHFLRKLGHHPTVISPTNWADWLKWMPGCAGVIDYEYSTEKAVSGPGTGRMGVFAWILTIWAVPGIWLPG